MLSGSPASSRTAAIREDKGGSGTSRPASFMAPTAKSEAFRTTMSYDFRRNHRASPSRCQHFSALRSSASQIGFERMPSVPLAAEAGSLVSRTVVDEAPPEAEARGAKPASVEEHSFGETVCVGVGRR